MKVRLFFEGAGAAVLLFLPICWDLLSPYHLSLYHNPYAVSSVAGGIAIDLLAACILFAAMVALLDRYGQRQTSPVWAGILIWLILKTLGDVLFFLNYYSLGFLPGTARKIIQFVVCATVLLFWIFFRLQFLKCVNAARAVLVMLGCSILWMLPQLGLIALHSPPKIITAFNKPVDQALPDSSERVVWILFDELSYDQAFEHRQPDVRLSRFDQLQKESTSFADVRPAGYFTDAVVPSLLLGKKLDNIRSTLQGDLYVHEAESGKWRAFNPAETLFYSAKQSGWTAGVVGWFNPYCRILQGALDSCYWQFIPAPFSYDLSEQKTALGNALALARGLTFSRFRKAPDENQILACGHIQEYSDTMQAAVDLLRNESIRFVFIHLPVPHPPGIYDRKTGAFNPRGTYLDNLVLADKALGTLLDEIGKTASAPRTTLIVSSDHSWRIGLWRPNASWDDEEERASKGNFDPRPVLLIHFPGQTAGATNNKAFAEIKTRALMEAILSGEIHSGPELDRWVAEH